MHGLPNQMVVGFANLVTMEELEEMTVENIMKYKPQFVSKWEYKL